MAYSTPTKNSGSELCLSMPTFKATKSKGATIIAMSTKQNRSVLRLSFFLSLHLPELDNKINLLCYNLKDTIFTHRKFCPRKRHEGMKGKS